MGYWLVGSAMAQSSGRKVISKDSLKISDQFKKKIPEQDTSKSLKSIYNRNKDKVSNAYLKTTDTTKTKKYTLDNSDSNARNKVASGKTQLKNKVNEKTAFKDSLSANKVKGKHAGKKSGIKNSISEKKEGLIKKTDSTSRKEFTTSLKAKGTDKKDKWEQKAIDTKQTLKNKASYPFDSTAQFKEKVKASVGTEGSIKSESYTTNYLLSTQPGNKTYTRLYGNSTVTMLTLPFTIDFYLTTEKNTLYNANSFSFNFDSDKFKQNLEDKAKKKIKEKTDAQNELKRGIMGKESELNKLNKLADTKKKLLAQKQEEFKNMPEDKADEYKQKVDDYKDKSTPDKEKLEKLGKDKVKNKGSEVTGKSERQKDSLQNEAKKIQDDIDALEQKIVLAQKAIGLLKHSDSIASNELKQLKDGINANSSKAFLSKNSGKVKGLDKVLAAIDKFDIGIFNANYTQNSLSGITVKGINTTWNGRNLFGNATIGNTYRDQIAFNGFNTARPTFDRHLMATLLGYGNRKENNIYIIGMGIKDKPKQQVGLNNSFNLIGGAGGQLKWGKFAIVKGEWLYSHYEKNIPSIYNPETNIFINDTQFYNPKVRKVSNMAFNVSSSIFPTKNIEVKTSWKWVGPGYRSLGSPYTRTNYDEKEVALKWKLFKGLLNLNGFYKVNKADPLNFREGSYTMSGYGLNARTNFKKLPNLFFNYSPFEQGNNSPDSLLKSNNKFSILTSGLSYRYTRKKVTLFSNAIFTRSHTEFRQLQNRIGNQYNFTFSQTVQYNKKISVTALYTLSKTNPSIDSLNNYRVSLNATYSPTRKLSAGIQYDGGFYQNGAFMQRGCTLFNYTLKKSILLHLKYSVGKLEGLYGVGNQMIYEGMFGVEWRW